MSFSPSPRGLASQPRYVVSLEMVEGNHVVGVPVEGTRCVEYCETWADVCRVLRRDTARLRRYEERDQSVSFSWVREPNQWFAAACKTSCFLRRQPFYVAKATNGERAEVVKVIAL